MSRKAWGQEATAYRRQARQDFGSCHDDPRSPSTVTGNRQVPPALQGPGLTLRPQDPGRRGGKWLIRTKTPAGGQKIQQVALLLIGQAGGASQARQLRRGQRSAPLQRPAWSPLPKLPQPAPQNQGSSTTGANRVRPDPARKPNCKIFERSQPPKHAPCNRPKAASSAIPTPAWPT